MAGPAVGIIDNDRIPCVEVGGAKFFYRNGSNSRHRDQVSRLRK